MQTTEKMGLNYSISMEDSLMMRSLTLKVGHMEREGMSLGSATKDLKIRDIAIAALTTTLLFNSLRQFLCFLFQGIVLPSSGPLIIVAQNTRIYEVIPSFGLGNDLNLKEFTARNMEVHPSKKTP